MKKITNIKVQSSSLIETLLATVIIMVVFGIAMVTIGNMLENTTKYSTSEIDVQLNKLTYLIL